MTESDSESSNEDAVESPPAPREISYTVWHAVRELNAITTTLHKLDGDFPVVTAKEAKGHLESAQESIETAIDQLDGVIQYYEELEESTENSEGE